ncbi:hypothetical protein SPOG_04977 [Schizosaccharomyces cryophilus OY26]|uniref:Uncharacterized protein n=1 Tax=Schizosaccharomyces cryophilus (strain OY26 / ATCC MYA-4695 / CBS 11777 / NBRC 106824 / NRRL Y48691) TaxID=653667 RepID=S9W165_SCHCR|nr:uncharacterized protein SPOG_04977 [Schizosaccharomyces cryophilus OY26]EPY52249.1 hypothetical protein SPOG_04977 [Schizosaccharomyces cryophilus OY26]
MFLVGTCSGTFRQVAVEKTNSQSLDVVVLAGILTGFVSISVEIYVFIEVNDFYAIVHKMFPFSQFEEAYNKQWS